MDSTSDVQTAPPETATLSWPKRWRRRLAESPPWGAVCLAVLLFVALAVRLYRLSDVPANVTADEADFLLNAWHVLAGQPPGLFGFDWTPSPALSVYIMAGTMKVFGASIFGARMSPVLLSIGTLVAFYFLAHERLSQLASLLATLLLATNLWFLHFSRTAWTNMNGDLFAVGGTLMLALAIRKGRWYWYAAAGAFAALGLYGYFSAHLVIFFFLAYLPVALLLNRGKALRILAGYVILVVVCFLVFLPQIKPVFDSWEHVTRRVDTMSVFNVRKPYMGESHMPLILARQGVWAARGFVLIESGKVMTHANAWMRYLPPDRGLLDPFVRSLFLLGLVTAVWRWRQTSLWLVMFVGAAFGAQILSSGTPDAARGLIAAPFMFLFVAEGIGLLLDVGRRLNARFRWTGIAVAVVLVAAVAASATMNVRDYFDWINTPTAQSARRPAVSHEAFPLWSQLQQEAAQKNAVHNFHEWCGRQDSVATRGTTVESVCLDVAVEEYGADWKAEKVDRDEQRRSDIATLGKMLASYREQQGTFPSTGGAVQLLCAAQGRDAGCELSEFKLGQVEALRKRSRTYWYTSDGSTYTLYAVMEGAPEEGKTCPSVPKELASVANVYCVRGS